MSYKKKLKNISTFVFDVDGVLTDGLVILDSSGEMVRSMHTKDGYALQHAIKKGYNICIITGGSSMMVKKRLQGLGIQDVFMSVHEKQSVFETYLKEKKVTADQVVYMGDDLPDFPCIDLAAIGCCPNDAAVEIREISNYISHLDGGKGCVRDILEQTMRVQGKWMDKDAMQW